MEDSFHCSDVDIYKGDEISGLILGGVELFVGAFNLIFCYMILKNLNKEKTINRDSDEKASELRMILNQDEDFKKCKLQLMLVGYGGFISSILRAISVGGTYALIKMSKNYV